MKHIYSKFSFILLLLLGSTALYASSTKTYYSEVSVSASPTGSGTVYVKAGSSFSGTKTTDSQNSQSASEPTHTYSIKATKKAGTDYKFLSWSGDNVTIASSTSNPTTCTIKATATSDWWPTTGSATAIFGRMAANTPASGSTIQFGDVTTEQNSSWQTIKIEHVNAGTISLGKTGHSADFLIASAADEASECASFSSGNVEKKGNTSTPIYVRFQPTTNGLRTCTLTVSSSNGLSSIKYYFKGTGYATPSVKWVDGEGNELISGETTLGIGDVIRATCTSNQTITYTDYNTTYFTPGTDASGNPILTVKEGFAGTIKNLTIKAKFAKNSTTYYAEYTEPFTLNVTNLTPVYIEWNDEISDMTNNNLPYDSVMTAVARNARTGENTGLTVKFKKGTDKEGVVTLSGNKLTINKLGGPIAITAYVEENSTYAEASLTKYLTVIDMKNPCATEKYYDGGSFNSGAYYEIAVETPDIVSFRVRREKTSLIKNFVVTEYDDNNAATTHKTSYGDITTNSNGDTLYYQCKPNTVRIRFAAEKSARYTYYVTKVKVTRVTSSNVDKTALSYNTQPGQKLGQNLKVTYSNIPVFFSFKSDEATDKTGTSLWSVNKTHTGGCGKRGEEFISVTFKSNMHGNYTDTLYVRNNVGDLQHTIKLTASVTLQDRELGSYNIAQTYNTTDKETLVATTVGRNDNFTYSVVSSTPSNIVNLSANGVMTFNGKGSAKIKAYNPIVGIYDSLSVIRDITINAVTPDIKETPSVAGVTCYETLTNELLSGGEATVTLHGVADTHVDGSFVWKNAGQVIDQTAGTYDYTVEFVPTDQDMYNTKTFTVPVTVNRAEASVAMRNGSVVVSMQNEVLTLDMTDKLLISKTGDADLVYTVVSDNVAHATIAGSLFSADQPGDYTVRCSMAETDYYTAAATDFTITVTEGVIFAGVDGDWSNEDNWSADALPTAADRVIINADVTVRSEVETAALTIEPGNTVTIADGGTLTIGSGSSLARAAYGNIVVEAGGQLRLNTGEVQVNDFTLYSTFDNHLPKSGQVARQQQLTTHGDAYFVLDLDSAGVASYGWYGFTVPFPVDALNGITRFENGGWQTITNEVNYAIMDYHEDLRAQGKYGWKKYRGILQPGTGYLMTVENAVNRYRFRMVEGGTFNAEMTQNLVATEGSELDKGWNSIGNGTMAYVSYDEMPRYAQLLDHKNNTYQIIRTASNAFVVGAAYFVQTTDNSTLTMIDASDATTGLLRAPQRRQMDEEYCSIDLSLSADGRTCDNLFITCSDNAVTTYTIGKDVLKMGATSDATVARLWSPAKDAILGAVDMPFSNDEAVIPLNIYAPKAGEYALTVDNSPTEDICLMRDGVMVWNMSTGAFALDLTAGTDRSYALRVTRRTNNVATGAAAADVDQCGADLVEKIIVNGQFFILRNGVMYDAQGRKVANF